MSLGGWEWVILIGVAVLLFGGARIASLGKGAGQAIREFKEEVNQPTGAATAPESAPAVEAPAPATEAPPAAEAPPAPATEAPPAE
jgi:sec-independent protein translocase protein TatA